MEYLTDPDVKEDADVKEDPNVKEDPDAKEDPDVKEPKVQKLVSSIPALRSWEAPRRGIDYETDDKEIGDVDSILKSYREVDEEYFKNLAKK